MLDLIFNILTTPVYIVFIGLEMCINFYRHLHLYNKKDTINNILLSLLETGIDLALKGVALFVLMYFNRYAPLHISNAIWYWALLFFAEDFMYWFLHWADHNVRLLWAVHVTHHSSEQMNLTVAIRSSVFQPVYRYIFFIPIALAGFHAADIILMYAICNAYGFFIHTELVGKLGFLEYFMATPSNHRVHHGSNVKYLDRNMGMVLVIWDRLFGTYTEEDEKVVYGLTRNVGSDNILDIIAYEWRNMIVDLKQPGLTTTEKFMYIFGPPGWSHDGSRLTAKQMRKQLELNQPAIVIHTSEPEKASVQEKELAEVA
jgi:sterol desaturase/sphingolipid hydroxylase (fatty acid hydroxylase superfamily)